MMRSKALSINMIKFLLIGLLFWGVFWSGQFFIAGNAYYSVKNSVEQWQEQPSRASIDKAHLALKKIETAIKYFPNNALYLQMRGQVYEWLAFIDRKSESNQFLESAMASYHNSLTLRPKWSASWVGLASSKWKLNQLDDEFYSYLDSAQKVGPQDALLHSFIAEFGLSMFHAKSIHYVKIKGMLAKHLHRGLQNPLSRERVLQSIEKYSLEKTVCRWLKSSPYPVRKQIPNCVSYD